ncbi:MAG TPA: class I SAM-dependent methyltransferase [Actinomycetota bacterium]
MARFFDVAYEGTPAWDIGRPQPAIVRLAQAGAIEGSVLDVGCGTGEQALFLAARGHALVGVDLAPAAIAKARTKAEERGIDATFVELDALRLDRLGRTFDTALDVGMFHTLEDEERRPYAASLAAAVRAGGRCYLLCWSERNDWGFGPRRVSQMELRGTFTEPWRIDAIDEERFETRLADIEVHAWLTRMTRG